MTVLEAPTLAPALAAARRRAAVGRVWRVVWIAAVCAFALLPLVAVLMASVSDTSFWSAPPQGLTFRWYARILGNPEFVASIGTSFALALIVSVVSVSTGFLAALGFTRGRRGVNYRASNLILLPLLFPHVALGLAIYGMYLTHSVPINLLTLALGQLVLTVPVAVRLIMVAVARLPRDVERAATNLGAGPWAVFWRVIVPQLRGVLVAAAIISFTVSFDDSGVALFVNTPTTITLPVRLLFYRENEGGSLLAAGGSVLLLIGVVIVLVVGRVVGLERAFGFRTDK